MSSSFNNSGIIPFRCAEDIPQFARVSLNSDGTISVVGNSDGGIGVTTRFGVSGHLVAVQMNTSPSSMKMISSGAIESGADVFASANGKVAAAGGVKVGVALTASTSRNEIVEVSPRREDTGSLFANSLSILYEESFSGVDGTPISAYGWDVADGETWTTNNGTIGSDNVTTRASRDMGARPARIEANIVSTGATPGNNGILCRFVDEDNYYLCRWSASANQLQILEKIGGSASVLDTTSIQQPARNAQTIRVDDDGSDIIVTILDTGDSVSASAGGGAFTNSFSSSTRVGFQHSDDKSFLMSVRIWQDLPTYDNKTNISPMFGATEYWVPPGVRHVGDHDRTYFGWISEHGVVQIRHYDHATKSWSQIVDIDNLFDDSGANARDDHNTPNIVIASDGTVLVFYCVHLNNNKFWVRRSTNPEDISSFDARIDLSDSGFSNLYNYPQCYRVTNGDLVLCYRYQGSLQGVWKTKRSTDNGLTWSTPTTIADFFTSGGFGVYLMTRQDPSDANRIIAGMHLSSSSAPTRRNIYFIETLDGGSTWQQSDGTAITLPATSATAEEVFSSGAEPVRILGLAALTNGARIIFGYKDDPNNELQVVQKSGESWTNAKVADSQVWWNDNGTSWYIAGGDVNPIVPSEIVVSVQVDDIFEIQKYVTTDNGQTWKKSEDVTADSLEDQWRPMYFSNPVDGFDLCWCSGYYTGVPFNSKWTGYDNARLITPLNKNHRQ